MAAIIHLKPQDYTNGFCRCLIVNLGAGTSCVYARKKSNVKQRLSSPLKKGR